MPRTTKRVTKMYREMAARTMNSTAGGMSHDVVKRTASNGGEEHSLMVARTCAYTS